MSDTHVRVILNPSAGSGGAMRKLEAIGDALKRYELRHEIVLTKARGHAAELARAARTDGVDVIAVVGGDGTLNEVAQAYLDPNGEPVKGPDFALIPSGTGGDFKKTLGLSGALDEAVARIRYGSRRPIDLGVLRITTHEGGERPYAFVNIASFGIGGQVDAIVNQGSKWLGGQAAFFVATLRAMAKYRNAAVRVQVDGQAWFEGPIFNVAIANGRYFGGGMMIRAARGPLRRPLRGDRARRPLEGEGDRDDREGLQGGAPRGRGGAGHARREGRRRAAARVGHRAPRHRR